MGEFVSGPYTGTYGTVPKTIGATAQGYTVSHEFFKRIIQSDIGAQTPVDAIYQGRAQFIEMDLIEAAAEGIPDMIDPYATVRGTPLTLGDVGALDVGHATCTGLAMPLILTAVAGTCAAAHGPATLTLHLCMLAEGYPVRILLGPDLRTVPIRLRSYPDGSGVFGVET